MLYLDNIADSFFQLEREFFVCIMLCVLFVLIEHGGLLFLVASPWLINLLFRHGRFLFWV